VGTIYIVLLFISRIDMNFAGICDMKGVHLETRIIYNEISYYLINIF